MHELAVCQSLLGQVDAVARSRAARAVTDIYVGVGPLSGVEIPLMRSAFPLAAAGTVADGARLHLDATTVRVRCNTCGAETAATVNHLVCGECGDWRTQLSSGDELLLQRIELQVN